MPRNRFRNLAHLALAATVCLGAAGYAHADIAVTGSFGPNGDVGFANSPPTLSITFGPDGQGSIYQMDGFINASNANLTNGAGFGTSAELTYGPPTGIDSSFASTQPSAHELLLTYTFVNTGATALQNFQFLHFVDGDIGPNFSDESATVSGVPGPGAPSLTPHTYQVGDPSSSTIFTHLLNGTLDNTNAFAPPHQGDVSFALGFLAGTLGSHQQVKFQVLLSDDGSVLPGLAITQTDPVLTADKLTISGGILLLPTAVPEPSNFVLGALGLFGLVSMRRFCARLRAG